MKKLKIIAICVAVTAILVAVVGFLSSGYKRSDLTLSPEEVPEIAVEDVITYEGWRIVPGSMDNAGEVLSYRFIIPEYGVDLEIIEKYEKQGYDVEYGILFGVGKDKKTGTLYNTTSDLAVKEVDGKLISATAQATAYLAYSSNEDVETDISLFKEEGSSIAKFSYIYDFGENIDVSDERLNAKTYVSAAFVRLTDSNGKVQTEYIPAREVLSIVPLELGDFK